MGFTVGEGVRCGGEWQRTLADAAVLLKFLAVVEEDLWEKKLA